jgi:cell division protein FtsW (lipid II flippase)
MIKEMADIATTVAVNKIVEEKRDIDRRIAFFFFKGVLFALALIFFVVALFIWLSEYTSMSMAATFTACACLVVAVFVHLIQLEINKKYNNKQDEWVKIFVPLVEAFAEGLSAKERMAKV